MAFMSCRQLVADNEYFKAGAGFELQHAVVKELGYPPIKTVKDFENALKAYKDKHPTHSDGKPIIPLSLNAGEWQILITTTNPAVATTGAPDEGEFYIDPKTYEVKFHYLRPEEKEYFRWLNHRTTSARSTRRASCRNMTSTRRRSPAAAPLWVS